MAADIPEGYRYMFFSFSILEVQGKKPNITHKQFTVPTESFLLPTSGFLVRIARADTFYWFCLGLPLICATVSQVYPY